MFNAVTSTSDIDLTALDRHLDRVKSHVFLGNAAAFLGSLMCQLNFMWTKDIPTAAVDGTNFYWNPDFFTKLTPEAKATVLMHELWHIACLHMLRRGARIPLIWNWACDIHINNKLENEGYSFEGIEDCWKDQSFGDQPPEDIYDQLIIQNLHPPCMNPFGSTGKATYNANGPPQPGGDMLDPTAQQKQQAVASVVQAAHSARMSNQAGSIPGEIESVIKQFLAPIIKWEILLARFFEDLLERDYSWQARDRRYPNIYMPGDVEDTGKLEHLIYYLDVSGSVTDAQAVRFNSEVKFIKDTFNPKKLTLVQFDTRITDEKEFLETDPFDEIVIIGRGGTDLRPVHAHIIKSQPTAAIIFSDLWCAPMDPLPVSVPVIWVAINNLGAEVPFGQIIHIKE